MNGKDLKALIESTKNTVAPREVRVDWGSRKGKNAMADSPVGVRIYTDRTAGLSLNRVEHIEYHAIHSDGQKNYLRARSAGFNHDEAMIVGYVGQVGVSWEFAAERLAVWRNKEAGQADLFAA